MSDNSCISCKMPEFRPTFNNIYSKAALKIVYRKFYPDEKYFLEKYFPKEMLNGAGVARYNEAGHDTGFLGATPTNCKDGKCPIEIPGMYFNNNDDVQSLNFKNIQAVKTIAHELTHVWQSKYFLDKYHKDVFGKKTREEILPLKLKAEKFFTKMDTIEVIAKKASKNKLATSEIIERMKGVPNFCVSKNEFLELDSADQADAIGDIVSKLESFRRQAELNNSDINIKSYEVYVHAFKEILFLLKTGNND